MLSYMFITIVLFMFLSVDKTTRLQHNVLTLTIVGISVYYDIITDVCDTCKCRYDNLS